MEEEKEENKKSFSRNITSFASSPSTIKISPISVQFQYVLSSHARYIIDISIFEKGDLDRFRTRGCKMETRYQLGDFFRSR